MPGTIIVWSPFLKDDYQDKHVTANGINQVIALTKDTGGLSPRTICFIPARTDSLANLAQDLFFPLVIHVAMRIKHQVKKVLFVAMFAVVDCATLAIRVITLIPRYVSNKMRTPHVFAQYLKEKNAPRSLIEAPQVNLYLEWREDTPKVNHQMYRRVPLTEMPPHKAFERSSSSPVA